MAVDVDGRRLEQNLPDVFSATVTICDLSSSVVSYVGVGFVDDHSQQFHSVCY